MTIYGRFGDPVTVDRLATIEDVEKLEGRSIDEKDLDALEKGAYVVVKYVDDGKEAVHHVALLKADCGAAEIGAIVDRLLAEQDAVVRGVASAPPRDAAIHVIDQEGQPYGSTRRCCNMCGAMAVAGMRAVLSLADWRALPPEKRCDRPKNGGST